MNDLRRLAARAAVMVLALTMVPACSRDDEEDDDAVVPTPAPNPPSGEVVLFNEAFDGAFPGSNWTAPASSGVGPSATIAAGEGNPAPSLAMTTSAGPAPMSAPLFLSTNSTTTITGAPFTLSADLMVPAAGEGSGAIAVLDGSGTPLAAAEWHPTDQFGAVTFMIVDPLSPTPSTVGVPPPAAGAAYHSFRFSVSATGEATWKLDGGAPAMTQTGFPAGPYTVRLYLMVASSTGPYATFHFDNVKATAP